MGIFVADLCFSDQETILSSLYKKWLDHPVFILCVGYLVGGYFLCVPTDFCGIYAFWSKIPSIEPRVLRAVGCGLLLYAIYKTSGMQRFLSNKLFLNMGKISFAVYAFHWPIMLLLQTRLFDAFRKHTSFSYQISAILSFVATLPIIYFISYVAWFFIEKNSTRFSVQGLRLFYQKLKERRHKKN